jgi:tRNA threonylcarbamoyladenosine biosynthesis protein TsaE
MAGPGADGAGSPAGQAAAVHGEIMVATAARMKALGEHLAALLRPGDLVVLTGPLGAGKTTLVQGIAAGLRVRGPVTSPTFVIARIHPALQGGPALVHADAFRLGSRAEIDDLDLDADTDDCVTVVEWGEGLVEELAPSYLQITIAMNRRGPGGTDSVAEPGDEPRTVVIAGWGERWAEAADPARLGRTGAWDAL